MVPFGRRADRTAAPHEPRDSLLPGGLQRGAKYNPPTGLFLGRKGPAGPTRCCAVLLREHYSGRCHAPGVLDIHTAWTLRMASRSTR